MTNEKLDKRKKTGGEWSFGVHLPLRDESNLNLHLGSARSADIVPNFKYYREWDETRSIIEY